ncbi:hypothetical protein JCM11641_001415 [Rhodosporidiobolus odoratus]
MDRLRTVSSQLRNVAGLEDSRETPSWSDWTATGYSPDRQTTSNQPYLDPYAEILTENAYPDFGNHRSQSGSYQPGLGFEVQMQMSGVEQGQPQQLEGSGGLAGAALVTAGDGVGSQAYMAQHTLSYPASAVPSPARSRASSCQSNAPASLQMSALTSPTSPFFPGGLPSPFQDHSASFPFTAAGTINPAQSVRSSSPSDTSSVSNLNMSRIESGSAASSVYADSSSTCPSTPYRSGSLSSRGTGGERPSHQKHLRRRSSPMKGARHSRKLSNADRKAICQFHLAHPGVKQDDIGAHFGYERSTISKTLKYKDKYLAMGSDDESSATAIIRSAEEERKAQYASCGSSHGPSPEASGQYGEFGLAGSPQKPLAASSSVSSLGSLDSYAGVAESSSGPAVIVGGRFPAIDNALAEWARDQVMLGNALTDASMQAQSRKIAKSQGSGNFKASQTWLDGFKHRAGISNGTFRSMPLNPPSSPLAPVPTTSHRWLPPPKEEEDEEDEEPVVQDEDDEDYDLPSNARRSKRRHGNKTIRRLTDSAKSQLASFADGLVGRSSTPSSQRISTPSGIHGGNFGDLSLDADVTPTHTTIQTRAATDAAERSTGLAQPFSYSPSGVSDTGSVVTSTPSRQAAHAPSPLNFGAVGSDEYSPTDSLEHSQTTFGYPGGLAYSNDFASVYGTATQPALTNSSSRSSLANFNGGNSAAASPAPVYRHDRSGSTASTNSVYSGLTAFSTHSQSTGTPLTGSLYGSFRDSQTNLCSVPGTPAGGLGSASTTGYFTADQQQPSIFPASSSSQYSQLPPSSQHSQHSSQQQGYPHITHPSSASHAYPPGTPSNPHAPHDPRQQDEPGSAGRRATISGGAPFSGRNTPVGGTAMSSSLSQSPFPSTSAAASTTTSASRPPVSLEQAFSSLEIAIDFLTTRAGQSLNVGPKDLVVLYELKAKMDQARASSLSSSATAPPTPTSAHLGASPFLAQQAAFPPSSSMGGAATVAQKQSQRLRLSRTQSTGSVPSFGMMGGSATLSLGSSGALERGMTSSSSRRFEVYGL